MNYELAKQLKDAGFPQTEEKYCRCGFLTEQAGDGIPVIYDCKTERVSKPDLAELIAACGDGIGLFKASDHQFNAWIKNTNGSGFGETHAVIFKGATPEEAVAHLWLALKNTK